MASTLVSACLLGKPCRYDGGSKLSLAVGQWLDGRGDDVIAVCPEQLGGLGTPRPAAWLVGGDGVAVLDGRARVLRHDDGGDVSAAFIAGAERAAALGSHAGTAVLKARSPSCGCGQVWIDGKLQAGDGVFAALLRRRGLVVLSDQDLLDRDRWDRRWASRSDPVGPPSELLRALDDVLPTTGPALDVAAGRGRQARWLARRGLDVTAVDVSPVGLATMALGALAPTVQPCVADLSLDPLPAGPWDVICCVDFYLPTLFPALCAALAPGGWLIFAHPTLDNLSRHAHPSARFLVPADQVRSLVPDLEIQRCDAAWRQNGRHEAWLVARRG